MTDFAFSLGESSKMAYTIGGELQNSPFYYVIDWGLS